MECPLCKSNHIRKITSRHKVPVLQNVICTTQSLAKEIIRGDIELFVCEDCDFVFNAAYRQVNYNESYENNQACSFMFNEYMEDKAKIVANHITMSTGGGCLLVEIGCGQGEFLKAVMRYAPKEKIKRVIGFVPAARHGKINEIQIVSDYFSKERFEDVVRDGADHIICVARHVIEHIQDPNYLVHECGELPANTIDLFLETPDFRWILSNCAFEDIVYEHCSFFSNESINYLLKKFDFKIECFINTFNGQYMWIQSKKTECNFQVYQEKEKRSIDEWNNCLTFWSEEDRNVYIWGAGAKGVAFLNIFDPYARLIKAVIDINPKKAGNYLPGTGHRIISPDELRKQSADSIIIVMNANYLDEIKSTVKLMGLKNRIQIIGISNNV